MQVILLERIEKLGQMGQVVTVKPGYARNFLLPKRKALRATKNNLTYFETQRAHLEAANLKRRSEAEHVAQKMENVSVSIIRQASESGLLYGSVRTSDISRSLEAQGYSVVRSQIELPTPIKALGVHKARIILHPEVVVEIGVNVAQSEEEAAVQASKSSAE
jgi:large subunit ribosomal protein L9